MMNGYNPIEIDEFLDSVVKDCEAHNKELLDLQEESSRLMTKLDQLLKAQPAPRVAQEAPKGATVTNFGILKRLSNLEYEVFGKELDEIPSTPVTPSVPPMIAEPANHDVDNTRTCQF